MDETVKFLHQSSFPQGTLTLLEKIAANLPGMICQFLQQPDGSQLFLYVSSGCRHLYELEPEVLQADFHSLHKLIHPQDLPAFIESMTGAAATLKPWRWEGRIITPSGQLKWIQGTAQLEPQVNGDILGDGLFVDITDRKQTEAQLRLTAERDRLLTQTLVRIRSSLNLEQILQTTVTEVRQFLQVERVFIATNDANIGAKTVAESADPHYPSILGWSTNDQNYLQELRNILTINQVRVVEDTSQISVSPKLQAHYQQFQTKATLAVPIMLGEELFGALIANQCSGPRHWQPIEIDLLKQLSEQLAIAIQQVQLYQELAQLNTNLEHQVAERTAQLQQKMQELEEIQRVKDVVLHTVAHDLRTSVMGNLMVLQNLLKTQGTEIGRQGDKGTRGQGENTFSSSPSPHLPIPVSRSIIERMTQGNDRQLGMINSLLEIHSCKEQGLILHREMVQFSTLLQTVIQDLQPMLRQNQATLNNLAPEDLPLVMADTKRLQKVLTNLFTHALQHNPPGLVFTLQATIKAGLIRTQIQYNGTTMSKLECDRLFNLYVPNPQAPCSADIGLKMYLCRQIIQAHGGEIGVISNHKCGLSFWFTLPIATLGGVRE